MRKIGIKDLCRECYPGALGFGGLPIDDDWLPQQPFSSIIDAIRWATPLVRNPAATMFLRELPLALLDTPDEIEQYLFAGEPPTTYRVAVEDALARLGIDWDDRLQIATALRMGLALQQQLRAKVASPIQAETTSAVINESLQAAVDAEPETPPRSKLEPYYDVIRQLRRRRLTYKQIARFFADRLQVCVAPSTIHAFVAVRAKRARAVACSTQEGLLVAEKRGRRNHRRQSAASSADLVRLSKHTTTESAPAAVPAQSMQPEEV